MAIIDGTNQGNQNERSNDTALRWLAEDRPGVDKHTTQHDQPRNYRAQSAAAWRWLDVQPSTTGNIELRRTQGPPARKQRPCSGDNQDGDTGCRQIHASITGDTVHRLDRAPRLAARALPMVRAGTESAA